VVVGEFYLQRSGTALRISENKPAFSWRARTQSFGLKSLHVLDKLIDDSATMRTGNLFVGRL
jgi:hypothetical protein